MSHLLCACCLYSIPLAHFKRPHHAKGRCSGGHVCFVNTTSALLLEMCSVYHCAPWFHNATAIQNCSALLLPLHLPCSLPASLALVPQSYPVPCSCPTAPAMPFFQLCQSPFLSIAVILFNCKFLIFTKLMHCSCPVSCAIFHKKHPADTEKKPQTYVKCLLRSRNSVA